MKPFFIIAPPRTWTAWMANFMTWESSFCFHEAIPEVPRIYMLEQFFANSPHKYVGTSDNGSAHFAEALLTYFPDAKYVLMYKNREEVERELAILKMPVDPRYLDDTFNCMDMVKREKPDALVLDSSNLLTNLKRLWEHCTEPLTPDIEPIFWRRAEQLCRMHVTLDLRMEKNRLEFLSDNIRSLFVNDHFRKEEFKLEIEELEKRNVSPIILQ